MDKAIDCYALVYQGMLAKQMGLGEAEGGIKQMQKEIEGTKFQIKGSTDQGRHRHPEGASPEGRRERYRRDRLRPRERRVEDAPAAMTPGRAHCRRPRRIRVHRRRGADRERRDAGSVPDGRATGRGAAIRSGSRRRCPRRRRRSPKPTPTPAASRRQPRRRRPTTHARAAAAKAVRRTRTAPTTTSARRTSASRSSCDEPRSPLLPRGIVHAKSSLLYWSRKRARPATRWWPRSTGTSTRRRPTRS